MSLVRFHQISEKRPQIMTPIQSQVGRIADQAAKLQGILQAAVAAIVTADDRGLIENVNLATERLFGYSAAELVGQSVNLLMPEPHRRQHDRYIEEYLTTGTKKIIGIGREESARRKDGTTFPIHLAISEFDFDGRRYFTAIIHDLSDRKRVEDKLRASERKLAHSQKLEAIGQLTGGIAHEFNNLLLVILAHLEWLEPRLFEKEAQAVLKEAQDAVDTGARLIDQLLAFAERRPLKATKVCLNGLLWGITDMLARTLGKNISVSTSLASDLWYTRVDAGQLQSAIVNLAVNARDAMPSGGRLIFETRNVTLARGGSPSDQDQVAGDYALLSVSDTGTGMPREVCDRAFEPFFTTKQIGHGTGLGLSMVYGFIKQSGGHVTINSEVGNGTTVHLYLPRTSGG